MHCELHLSPSGRFIVVVQQRHLALFHTETHQLTVLDGSEDPNSKCSEAIRSISFNIKEELFCSVGDDKILNIYSTKDGSCVGSRKLDKKLSACTSFCHGSDETLAVSDRFGSVYGFEWTDLKLAMEAQRLLGHIGIITDLCTSSSQKFIVSADFEGKIRVSNLPNTYSIESFCLGHEKPVTKVMPLCKDHLLSAAVDATLRVWNLQDGECIGVIDLLELKDVKALPCEEEKVPAVLSTSYCEQTGVVAVVIEGLERVLLYKFDAEACTLKLETSIELSTSAVSAVCDSAGRVLLVTNGGKLRLFKLHAAEESGRLQAVEDSVDALLPLQEHISRHSSASVVAIVDEVSNNGTGPRMPKKRKLDDVIES